VVPGMKALKKISVHGEAMKVQRYRPLDPPIDSEYDEPEQMRGQQTSDSLESFNRFSLEMVLKDCLEIDPAVRYQIAKSAFERALYDAIVSDYYCYCFQSMCSHHIIIVNRVAVV